MTGLADLHLRLRVAGLLTTGFRCVWVKDGLSGMQSYAFIQNTEAMIWK